MEGPEIARYPRDLQRLCGCLVWRHVSWEQWLGVDLCPHASRRGAESVRGQEETPGETAGPAKAPQHARPCFTVAAFEAEAAGMVRLRLGGEFDGPLLRSALQPRFLAREGEEAAQSCAGAAWLRRPVPATQLLREELTQRGAWVGVFPLVSEAPPRP